MEADNKLEFLDDQPDEAVETATEAPGPDSEQAEQPEPEPEPEPEADAAPAEGEETGEKQDAEPTPGDRNDEEEPRMVPLTAHLSEREKRQQAEARLAEMERRLREIEAQREGGEDPQAVSDAFFDNPAQAVASTAQQVAMAERLKLSKFMAEKEFGPELVQEATRYFDEHQDESWRLLEDPSPFHAAVTAYKRAKLLSKVGDDPDRFIEAEVERRLQERLAQSVPSKPKAPPPSMAKARSAGGESNPPGSAFDYMLGD